jgi:hypothetical protein
MGQEPFEVRIVGWEAGPSSGPRIRAVTKADVAQDVTAELRKHFAGHPLDPDARPLTARTTVSEDFESGLKEAARRAMLWDSDAALEAAWIWQVVVAVPIGAFFASFGTEAGKDAYKALKLLMQRLSKAAARRQGAGPDILRTIELSDIDSAVMIELPDKLPDKAYRQLLAITLPPLPKGSRPDRLMWFDGRWMLLVTMPVPDRDRADDLRSPREVPVLMMWEPTSGRWTLPPGDGPIGFQ